MHVAAMKPESIDISDLDPKIIDNEKNTKRINFKTSKPEKIAKRYLMEKWINFIQVTLKSKYILDQEKSVKEIIKKYYDDNNYEITSFK